MTQTADSNTPVLSLCPSFLFLPQGLTHIITMDLHQKEIQGFFSFPVDNLRASPFLIQYIQEEVIVLLCAYLNIGTATYKPYQSIYLIGTQVLYSVFLLPARFLITEMPLLWRSPHQLLRGEWWIKKMKLWQCFCFIIGRFWYRCSISFAWYVTKCMTKGYSVSVLALQGSVLRRTSAFGSRCDPRRGSVFRVWHGRRKALAAMCSQHHGTHGAGASL